MIDDAYKNFVQTVAESRKKSFDEINRIAQGRVWSGEVGTQIGLIDIIGGLDKAIEIAKEKANIDASTEVSLIYYPIRKSFLTQILKYTSVMSQSMINPIAVIEAYIQSIQNIPMAIMPYVIRYY